MYRQGKAIHWNRRPTSLKQKMSGAVLEPTVPGFGQSDLKIMRDGKLYYVGTSWVYANGSESPYTVESEMYDDRSTATVMFRKMTSYMPEDELTEVITRNILFINESSLDKMICVFDLRDAIIRFLESRSVFPIGKVPVSVATNIENYAEELLDRCRQSSHTLAIAKDIGFGAPSA
tara:strand:- start:2310 stop:2837 length:528 start_codon:yes stop_codon:yes gene_type:complete